MPRDQRASFARNLCLHELVSFYYTANYPLKVFTLKCCHKNRYVDVLCFQMISISKNDEKQISICERPLDQVFINPLTIW